MKTSFILPGLFKEFGFTGMLQGCSYVFFAYLGFDAVSTVAQEAKEPTRTVPIAIITSLVVSLLIYIGIVTVMVGLVPYQNLNTDNPLSESM